VVGLDKHVILQAAPFVSCPEILSFDRFRFQRSLGKRKRIFGHAQVMRPAPGSRVEANPKHKEQIT
jgi:hypothetical protein